MKHMYAEVVYALAAPDGEVRYIGRTTYPEMRLKQHGRAKTPLGEWVRGVRANIVELEFCEYGKLNAGPLERHWIEHHRSIGSPLFNIWPMKPRGSTLRKLDGALAAIEAERGQ